MTHWRALPVGEAQLSLPAAGRRVGGQLCWDVPAPVDALEVTGFCESMGTIEGFLERARAALGEGGTLTLEICSAQAPRALREVVEGAGRSIEPPGDLCDAPRALTLARVLAALAQAGFTVRDGYRVPPIAGELGQDFAEALCEHGLVPMSWLWDRSQKYWIVAEARLPSSGSVVVAGADLAAREATVRELRTWLPEDWDVVVAREGESEPEQWCRAVPATRGRTVWFLRAGSRVDRDAFDALRARTALSPAVPADARGEPHAPGDVSGLMLSRESLMRVGAFDAAWRSPRIAFEELLLRLDAIGQSPERVECAFATPESPLGDGEVFASESAALLARWELLTPLNRSADESLSPPRCDVETPWVDREPRITLCMITRDEERFLGNCLESVRSLVDEIVIVDTGSTDRTVEIAEHAGAIVLHEAWIDDFSAPRNVGLSRATGDWVLVLDADETLEPEQCERIREMVRDPSVSGYHLRFTNLYSGGKTQGVLMVRLFRNLEGVHYVNRIHEQVSPSLVAVGEPQGLRLAISDIEVVHHGYTQEVIDARNKDERNERLFLLQLEQQPDDIYNLYKYGDFLRRIPGRQRDARDTLERCLDEILDLPEGRACGMPFAGEVAALCALEYARDEQFERAERILAQALSTFAATPNLHYIAASVAYYRGRWDDAITHYRRCLTYRDRTLVVPIQEGITGHVAIGGIAQAMIAKGQRQEGIRLLQQAIALEPHYDVNQLALSRLHLADGDVGEALGVLTRYLTINPESAGACHQAALILRGLGRMEQARRMGERAIALFESRAMEQEANQVRAALAG